MPVEDKFPGILDQAYDVANVGNVRSCGGISHSASSTGAICFDMLEESRAIRVVGERHFVLGRVYAVAAYLMDVRMQQDSNGVLDSCKANRIKVVETVFADIDALDVVGAVVVVKKVNVCQQHFGLVFNHGPGIAADCAVECDRYDRIR